ncbi:hypothetical protein ACWGCW_04485 [Streptomyces sp. NPDC054933]
MSEPNAGDGPPNYADNHGFMTPFPRHGEERCKGLAEVKRITAALEPLRMRHEFVTAQVNDRLASLGYGTGEIAVFPNGPTGVSFTVDLTPMCLEGTMDLARSQVQAHGGYPDSTGCTPRRGGH